LKNIITINNRKIGKGFLPFIIPEIGINHEGEFKKAKQMVYDAHQSGAECVKFQCHIIEDEMIFNNVIPVNADESIWEIMKRCSLTEEEEIRLKKLE
jgi:N-acetylneuraminate synthase